MNENQRIFVDSLKAYASNSLRNDVGWEPLQAVITGGLATVKIGLVDGHFRIIGIECADVTSLEKELKQAKKTIRQLESQIETLTPEEETTYSAEVTVTEEPKRTTRKRTG